MSKIYVDLFIHILYIFHKMNSNKAYTFINLLFYPGLVTIKYCVHLRNLIIFLFNCFVLRAISIHAASGILHASCGKRLYSLL